MKEEDKKNLLKFISEQKDNPLNSIYAAARLASKDMEIGDTTAIVFDDVVITVEITNEDGGRDLKVNAIMDIEKINVSLNLREDEK